MDVLGWIVIGLLAGALAGFRTSARDPGGQVVRILLGIAGALLGGFMGRLMGLYGADQKAGFVAALTGSAAILILYRLTIARR
ncbi:GlsB/YeaQ/YmgE family stress response membrane protein [Sphingobium abikonense]|uniref:GlsB/YeaQ/YmgE family stress response membrane protein n=1 Tax=Sphingobium abikonense TaxID=86193 RepID=UPI003512C392